MQPEKAFPDTLVSAYGYPYRPQPAPPPVTRVRATPRPAGLRELLPWAAAIAACDVALWDGTGGFGLAFLFLAIPIALAVAVRRVRTSARLLFPAALLVMVCVKCIHSPSPGAVLLGLFLTVAVALHLRQRSVFVPEILAAALSSPAVVAGRVAGFFRGIARIAGRTRLGRQHVLPVVVPALLGAVFVGVFAMANPLVERGLARALEALSSLVSLPSPLRVGLWGVLGVALTVLFRPVTRIVRHAFAMEQVGEATGVSLAIARNALVLLNVVFLAVNLLDAAYLWAGSPPPGVDTQKYAHAGAFWLTVALALVTATLGVLFRKELAFDPSARTARILGYAWVGQSFVLALGAYRRIAMHVARSGLSDLRLMGVFGTTLVCVGLGFVVVKLARRRSFSWLLRRQLDAFVAALVLFTLTPTHLISARVNVSRIRAGEYRPILHMFAQSRHAESAPSLLPLLSHEDVRVRQGIAALLLDSEASLGGDAPRRWTERELARELAIRGLSSRHAELEDALDGAPRGRAREVLMDVMKGANDDWSLEQILSIPAAGAGHLPASDLR
jgi:hypothetical protein